MALIRALSGSGGGTINPTLLKQGYVNTSSTTTQQLDTTKTYIVSASRNQQAARNQMCMFKIVNGTITEIYFDSNVMSNWPISIDSNGLLTITNTSGSYQLSYCISQID